MKLTFIYNAKSGRLNALIDSAHKVLSPFSYACDLCALTHGVWGEKSAWREFREESGLEFEFLHRDEVPTDRAKGARLPVVLKDGKVLISAEQLGAMTQVEELITLLREEAL